MQMKNRLLINALVVAGLVTPLFGATIQQEPNPEKIRTNVHESAREVEVTPPATANEELPVIFKLQTINGNSVWISEQVVKQAYETRFGKKQASQKKVGPPKPIQTAQAAPAPNVLKSSVEQEDDEE